MRVLVTASRWAGHYFPMVPLGWALQAAGHEVIVACAPGLADTVARSGLSAAPVCADTDLIPMNRFAVASGWGHPAGGGGIPLLHPLTGEELAPGERLDHEWFQREFLSPYLDGVVDAIGGVLDFGRSWRPELVISDLATPDGMAVARALRVPALWHLWGAVGPVETTPGLQFFRPLLTQIFDRYDLDIGPLDAGVIDPCPPAMAPRATTHRYDLRYVPYNGPSTMPRWLLDKPTRPRVAVAWGTSVTHIFGRSSFLVPKVLAALAGLDVEVVVAASDSDRALLGELPGNVVAAGVVPLHMLLPSCDAVIHHGGAGSLMTALDAGVPQLSLTFGGEQEVEADRLAQTGAGRHLPGRTATGEEITEAVRALLYDPRTPGGGPGVGPRQPFPAHPRAARAAAHRRLRRSTTMRVMFAVSNWPSHYYPMVPLGWGLQAAGHEVRVLCTADQEARVSQAGLLPVPVLEDLDLVFAARLANVLGALGGGWPYPVPPPHPVTGEPVDLAAFNLGAFMGPHIPQIRAQKQRSADAAVAFAREFRPDLVVHDPAVTEGLLAARVTGVPAVLHLWGPVGTHEGAEELDITPRDYSDSFDRYGVGAMSFDLVDRVVDVNPAALTPGLAAPALAARYLPYNGPATSGEEYRPAGSRPTVCVVWGNSVARTFGTDVFAGPRILAAVAELDVDVVLLANSQDLGWVGPLPANVSVLDGVPLHLLLPHCDVVVHSGTAGCAMTALAAGVPQLAVPHGFDQPLISRRIAATGAARTVPNADATPAVLAEALHALLTDPAYRRAAQALREANDARPAPGALVAELDQLARTGLPVPA